MIHDSVPRTTQSKAKVKVTEVRKLRKWPISKFVSSAGLHVIKRLLVNYDTPRDYLNFDRAYFSYSSASRDLQTSKYKEFARMFCWQTQTTRDDRPQ